MPRTGTARSIPYFVCVGRHQKRTTCTRKAILISILEELIEDYWADVALAPELEGASWRC